VRALSVAVAAHGQAMTHTETDMPHTLDAALAHWGLHESDLPGIRAAWDATFSGPADVVPEHETDVLRRLDLALADEGDLRVRWVNPRSNGTIVVLVVIGGDADNEDDEDDDELTREVTLGGEQMRAFLIAQEGRAERERLTELRALARRYATGELPVWFLLNAPKRGVLYRAQNLANMAARSARTVEATAENIQRMQNALNTLTPLDGKLMTSTIGFARGVQSWDPAKRGYNDASEVSLSSLNSVIEDYTEAKPKAEALSAALAEAEALPHGALRDFLLAECPEVTYNATEGTGRRKRTVKRSYRPTSDLVKEHRNAATALERVTARRDEIQRKLTVLVADGEPLVAAARAKRDETAADLQRVWATGWPGTPETAPAPREKSSPSF
jgi:hypothetical protein